jgi:hypothetical protein
MMPFVREQIECVQRRRPHSNRDHTQEPRLAPPARERRDADPSTGGPQHGEKDDFGQTPTGAQRAELREMRVHAGRQRAACVSRGVDWRAHSGLAGG